MKIGIVAATQLEVQRTIDFLRINASIPPFHQFEVIITGVGLLATAYTISNYVIRQQPWLLIQAGIGGSFTDKIPPGEVVIIKDEIVGDLGAEEEGYFHDLFNLGLLAATSSPYDQGRLKNPSMTTWEMHNLVLATGITVNEITTRAERIKMLTSKYNGEIESMEGAACHYICLKEKIPFLQLRAVSNYVGERDKKNWKLQLAIENLNETLIQIIKEIQPA